MSNRRYRGVIPRDKVIAIISGDEPQLLVEEAERAGEQLARKKLTKNQIRNIFGTVRQIQMSWPPSINPEEEKAQVRELLLLKPKLAYQAARQEQVKPLADVLEAAIDQVDGKRDRFQRFVELFEAILAYHTKYGGK
ncbi:MAG: type III-A CRISPR-associated protein Csm2 [Anaerolineae bacterium]|jgi:CRISPR-associated protein Csm2